MAVNVTVMTKEKQLERELESVDRLFVEMLRMMIIPKKGNTKTIWRKMSPDACKLYMMIWALTSSTPTKAYNGYKLEKYVPYETIRKHSELQHAAFLIAIKELRKLKLIEAVSYGDGPCAGITYEHAVEESKET